MGEQSKTRLDGDDYQHLYSWYELISLLKEDCPYDHGFVEHNEAGAADDVTLHATDSQIASRYVQVKYHVDFRRAYDFAAFLETKKATERSLLQKLFDSWKALRKRGPCEIWLVSNWACDEGLGGVVCGSSWTILDGFHKATPKSTLGKAKSSWKAALDVKDEDFDLFIKSLRLRFSFGGQTDLEEKCDDRMGHLGMKYGPGPRAHAIAAVRGWIKRGGDHKRIDRSVILEAIAKYDLRASKENSPKVSLSIHAWAKRAFDVTPTAEIDWTSRFNREERRIPDPDGWLELQAELRGVKDRFASLADAAYIDFRGKMPLSCGLIAGACFPAVGGYAFRTEQPSGTETALWSSNVAPSNATFVVRHEEGQQGDDILIVFAVTSEAQDDARALYQSGQVPFARLVYAEPTAGVGPRSIAGASDAVALAISAKNILRAARTSAKAKRLHTVFYGPLSLALFLGQQLNSLGTVVAYERTAEGGYQPSATIKTG